MPVAWTRFRVGQRGWVGFAVLGGYALLAFLYLGLRLLIDPGSQYLGFSADPKAFIWCFGWWPYAILHGQNPFVTNALWAPVGVNLIWTTSVPALALLFAPLTLLAGPVVSYNTAAVLVPAVNAWAAYALCRRLTGARWPAIVGGYLFGFSSYVLGQEEGHPHMAAVFVIPLVALVCLRYLAGELGGRGLALRLGPLFGLEFLISTEVTFTLGLAIAVAGTFAAVLVPGARQRLLAMWTPLLGGCAFAALLTAPFVYYAVTGFQSNAFHPPTDYVTDLLNVVVPTKLGLASVGWADSIARRFPGNNAERGAYLGVPLLLIVGLDLWRRVRVPAGRFLLAALAVAFVASLGFRLSIAGDRSIWLPWSLVERWPLFDNVLPARLSMYVALVAAVIVALWMAARPPGRVRWLLPGLAVLALLPNPAAGVWASRYTVPAFLTDRAYRGCLARDETVLPLPIAVGSESMLWQVSDGFRFRMAGGNIAPSPPTIFLAPQFIADVAEGLPLPRRRLEDLTTYIRVEHVTSVLVDPRRLREWSGSLDALATPERLGGLVVYHLRVEPGPCPSGGGGR